MRFVIVALALACSCTSTLEPTFAGALVCPAILAEHEGPLSIQLIYQTKADADIGSAEPRDAVIKLADSILTTNAVSQDNEQIRITATDATLKVLLISARPRGTAAYDVTLCAGDANATEGEGDGEDGAEDACSAQCNGIIAATDET
jgi:hypothetical protein